MFVSSVNGASAAYAVQAQQQRSAPQQKSAPAQAGQDSVQLSQTAQAALRAHGGGGGDADHDGDSH